jgi:D-serine dehydratase
LDQFIPALELWSQVLSIPDPKLAILNFGKRDAGNDLDNPVPIKKFSMNQALVSEFKGVINKLNDQHAFMSISERTLEIGQKVGLGISHPCTNFDKWRLIPLVDDNYDVKDCIFTQF